MIILDLGGGDVCQNNKEYITQLIDSISMVDTDRVCVIKWQMFISIPDKTPLKRDLFHYAYYYARDLGFETTASFFDGDSLDFIMRYNVPFIKIASQEYLRSYRSDIFKAQTVNNDKIIRKAVVASRTPWSQPMDCDMLMCCIQEYPASAYKYESLFSTDQLRAGISDHTDSIELYKKYTPKVYEKHYTLDNVSNKPREYALRPDGLKELLKIYKIYKGGKE